MDSKQTRGMWDKLVKASEVNFLIEPIDQLGGVLLRIRIRPHAYFK